MPVGFLENVIHTDLISRVMYMLCMCIWSHEIMKIYLRHNKYCIMVIMGICFTLSNTQQFIESVGEQTKLLMIALSPVRNVNLDRGIGHTRMWTGQFPFSLMCTSDYWRRVEWSPRIWKSIPRWWKVKYKSKLTMVVFPVWLNHLER